MTTATTRRRFIEIVPIAGVALFAACSPKIEPPPAVAAMPPPPPEQSSAPAPEPAPASPTATGLPMVNEMDAQAVALGYVADTARADKIKFASYVAGSECRGCALYSGKAGDDAGGCPLFQGKNVAAKGWCNSWVKKA